MSTPPSPSNPPRLLLIDGSHAIFRAYHALPPFSTSKGVPVNAVFGFTNTLLKLLKTHTPDYFAVVFDSLAPTFRDDLYTEYKATRPPAPPDLVPQFPLCFDVTDALGLPRLVLDGYEADDILGTMALRARAMGIDVTIVSSDKDLMQLVRDGELGESGARGPAIRLLDEIKGRTFDEASVRERWGVPPSGIVDLLAIMGDSVDNVPGVKGIGEKGASKLVAEFGALEAIYARIEEVQPERIRRLLLESKDSAVLSKTLVTIHPEVPVDRTPDSLVRSAPDRTRLTAMFRELEFKSLLREYFVETPSEAGTQAARHDTTPMTFRLVTDLAELGAFVAAARQSGAVAVDTETTSTDPMLARLVGVSLAFEPTDGVYVPVGHDYAGCPQQPRWEEVRAILAPMLADPAVAKYGHHHKYDQIVLERHGAPVRGLAFDTMLASYLVHPEKYAHSLDNVALDRLGYKMVAYGEVTGSGKDQVTFDKVPIDVAARCSAEDAVLTRRLADVLDAATKEASVDRVLRDIELPLSGVLARMEMAGVLVDVGVLAGLSASMTETMTRLEAEIHALAGMTFNLGSPRQLAEVLFDTLGLKGGKRTKTGFSTDQSVLEQLAADNPIVGKLLEWRQFSKLRGTYTDALPKLVNPHTGRIHTSFNQAVAATGRLSSTDPNLQNIPVRTPEGRAIREAFIAEPGCVLLSADYSQIELRLMAHMAGEEAMIAAFRRGDDIHRQTAAEIFGVFPEMVTKEQRSAAKAIVFGILYGMGAQRLAREIGVSSKDAQAFIGRYFARFSGVKGFVERVMLDANERQEVRTLYGRRRPLPDLASSNPMARAAAERIAVNSPVQGTAADVIKLAMLRVDRALAEAGSRARMLLQVHDELVLEVPEAEVARVAGLVCEAMEGVLAPDGPFAVPLVVEWHAGSNWAAAK